MVRKGNFQFLGIPPRDSLFFLSLPSGKQTWQWKIPPMEFDDFTIATSVVSAFPTVWMYLMEQYIACRRSYICHSFFYAKTIQNPKPPTCLDRWWPPRVMRTTFCSKAGGFPLVSSRLMGSLPAGGGGGIGIDIWTMGKPPDSVPVDTTFVFAQFK